MDRDELERRLRALGASVVDRLTDQQAAWFAEFLDVDEYALALECLADWLAEDDAPISEAERSEATLLATAMGNVDRVTSPLRPSPGSSP
jgi:hypothetical protein